VARTKSQEQIERRLQGLRKDYETLKTKITALGYVVTGSIQKRQYSCGKPNCRCVTEGILHGPYYQWTRKIGGKTVNVNLERDAAMTVKEWIKNNRKLRKLCTSLEKKSLAVLKLVANLEDI
jgi:hypothetical protein